jgi:hypothetical protein
MVMRIDEHVRAVTYVHRQVKPQCRNNRLRQTGKSCRRHNALRNRYGNHLMSTLLPALAATLAKLSANLPCLKDQTMELGVLPVMKQRQYVTDRLHVSTPVQCASRTENDAFHV